MAALSFMQMIRVKVPTSHQYVRLVGGRASPSAKFPARGPGLIVTNAIPRPSRNSSGSKGTLMEHAGGVFQGVPLGTTRVFRS